MGVGALQLITTYVYHHQTHPRLFAHESEKARKVHRAACALFGGNEK
jgi:hypothetical protein